MRQLENDSIHLPIRKYRTVLKALQVKHTIVEAPHTKNYKSCEQATFISLICTGETEVFWHPRSDAVHNDVYTLLH